ncbi:MAG: hypothetical protein M1836_004630 [Candelina mexicana]|nr:MAG: hypothetical protein M1836_004630 [Candelina mexicana]
MTAPSPPHAIAPWANAWYIDAENLVSVVFIHGLTGNRETTWTDPKTGTCWPQAQLPADLPQARIFTYGYDADVVRIFQTASSNTVRDHGKGLANELSLRRLRTRSNDRPLIFVAHSLGGLVCEQSLLICRGAAEKHLQDVLESTQAIAFMGTPHAGSDLGQWAKTLSGLANVLRKSNPEIVGVLQPGSETLAGLQQEFHVMLDARQKSGKKPIKIFCFFEEIAVIGVGEIVPKHSAILSAYDNRGIHANHMDMTKFSSADDAGYRAVSDQLWLWVNEIEDEFRQNKEKLSKDRKPIPEDIRQGRERMMQEASSAGIISTGSGATFSGNQVAGRDLSF